MSSKAGALVRVVLVATVAVTVLLGAAPALAVETRAGQAVRVGPDEVVNDDLYVASSRTTVEGRVRGDLISLGGSLRLRGSVDGDALVAAGTAEVLGAVGASLRVIAGTLVVEGAVGRDATVAGGTVEFERGSRIARDVAVAAGTVSLRGEVGRNAHLAGGRTEISGTVGGNVVVRGGEVVLLPTAVVRGSLTYSSDRPVTMSPGATVVGRVVERPYAVPRPSAAQALRGVRVVLGILDFFWLLVLALVLVAVVPGPALASAGALRGRPWASLVIGLALAFLIPVLTMMLTLTLVGIPLAIVVVLGGTLAVFLAHVAAALAIGQLLFPSLRSRYSEAAIGAGLIAIATNLPVVGYALRMLVLAFGLGALVVAWWGRRTPPAPAPTDRPMVA